MQNYNKNGEIYIVDGMTKLEVDNVESFENIIWMNVKESAETPGHKYPNKFLRKNQGEPVK